MIKTEDVVKHIEKVYKCKLLDFQVKLLDNIIHGKITNTPKNCGKTLIIKGYADYLNYVHDMCKYDPSIKVDDYISGEEVLSSNPSILNVNSVKRAFLLNPDKARVEYNIDFASIINWDGKEQ